jgi:hypothetical protein
MEAERTESFNQTLNETFALVDEVGRNIVEGLCEVNRFEDMKTRDLRCAEREESANESDRREFARVLSRPRRFDAQNFELAYIEEAELLTTYFAEREVTNKAISSPFHPTISAVLGRRVHKGQLFYKVAWRGLNLVTWEPDETLECRNLVEDFERRWMAKAMVLRSARPRPVTYITRRMARSDSRLQSLVEARRLMSPGSTVVWSCEIEPMAWIPYEDRVNALIDSDYLAGSTQTSFHINGNAYSIDFSRMAQVSESGHLRAVLRHVRLPAQSEREMLEAMTLEQLRQYVACLPEITELHYEALLRLHELDQVHVHASTRDLSALPRCRFKVRRDAGDDGSAFSSACAICLEDYTDDDDIVSLSCEHVLHHSCAVRYFEAYSCKCPVCKKDIRV